MCFNAKYQIVYFAEFLPYVIIQMLPSEVLHTFSGRVLCALAVHPGGDKVVRHRFTPEWFGFIRLSVVLHTCQSRGFLHKEYRDQLSFKCAVLGAQLTAMIRAQLAKHQALHLPSSPRTQLVQRGYISRRASFFSELPLLSHLNKS